MAVTSNARLTADRAAHSGPLEAATRAGFIGYGIVHLLFAWLAVQIAFGKPAQQGDQSGAMQELAGKPWGKTLLALISIGLVAMAVWQAFEAAIGHREDRGGERVAERLASAGRTLVYLYLAWTGYKVIKSGASSADQQQQTSTELMTSDGGRWLVAIAGIGLAVLGLGLIWYGYSKRFEKHLRMSAMAPRTRRIAERLGVAGYVAKGIAYGIAGVLLVVAAVNYDPEKARGLDAALRTLADQPYGTVLLVAVALGIAAFSVFCLVQAKFRKV